MSANGNLVHVVDGYRIPRATVAWDEDAGYWRVEQLFHGRSDRAASWAEAMLLAEYWTRQIDERRFVARRVALDNAQWRVTP